MWGCGGVSACQAAHQRVFERVLPAGTAVGQAEGVERGVLGGRAGLLRGHEQQVSHDQQRPGGGLVQICGPDCIWGWLGVTLGGVHGDLRVKRETCCVLCDVSSALSYSSGANSAAASLEAGCSSSM